MSFKLESVPNKELKKMITKEENEDVNDEIAGRVCKLALRLKRKQLTARIVRIKFPSRKSWIKDFYMDVDTGRTVGQLIDEINKKEFFAKVIWQQH